MPTLFDRPSSHTLGLPVLAELVSTYRAREPRDLIESLHAAVASYELTFGKHFVVPFVRTLRAGKMRHFDLADASTGLVDLKRLWADSAVELVRQTGAEVLTVAVQGSITSDELFPDERMPRQYFGTVAIDVLDGEGSHLHAMCLVDIKPRWVDRIADWQVHDVADLNLYAFDNDPAPVSAALARAAADRNAQPQWQLPNQ